MEVKDIISSGLLELYITGVSSPDETRQVEGWAEQYPEVKSALEEMQNVMESYVMSEAILPDESLKEKIMGKIRLGETGDTNTFRRPSAAAVKPATAAREQPQAKVFALPSYFKWMAAASIVILIGSLLFGYTFYTRYQDAKSSLQTAQNELQKQQQLADAMNKDMSVMDDKNAMPVVLNGTEKSPDALAKIFWMKNTGEVYVDPTHLPQAPSGMQYQLWAIVDGKPEDAGMIATEKGIYHIQKMKTFGKAQAFAITLEKAGGNPTPKGDMIVMAKI